MAFEEDLRAALKAAIGGALPVDWGWNAQGIQPPRVYLTTVSGTDPVAHDGRVNLNRRRVQVDCFATTPKAARDLADKVRSLNGHRAGRLAGVFVVGVRDGPPDTPGGGLLARVSIDLSIHYEELTP